MAERTEAEAVIRIFNGVQRLFSQNSTVFMVKHEKLTSSSHLGVCRELGPIRLLIWCQSKWILRRFPQRKYE